MDRNFRGLLKEIMTTSWIGLALRASISLAVADMIIGVQYLKQLLKVIPEGVLCTASVVPRGFPIHWALYSSPCSRNPMRIKYLGLVIDLAFWSAIAFLAIETMVYLSVQARKQ